MGIVLVVTIRPLQLRCMVEISAPRDDLGVRGPYLLAHDTTMAATMQLEPSISAGQGRMAWH